MIVPMKKIGLISLTSRKNAMVTALRDFGALHLDTQEGGDLDQLKEQESVIRQAIQAIPEEKSHREQAVSIAEAVEMAERVMESADLLKKKLAMAESLRREIMRIESWGNVDPQLFQSLIESGLSLFPALLPREKVKELPENLPYIRLGRRKEGVRFLFLADPSEFGYEYFYLSERSLTVLQAERATIVQEGKVLEEKLRACQRERRVLQSSLAFLAQEVEARSVEAQLEALEDCPSVTMIEGFLPAPRLADLRSFAATTGSALLIQDPSATDNVPTKIKNIRPVRMAEPIFAFMDTLPGYKEHDISFWFLIFFTLFFSMIIGDAGYGLLLSVVSLGAVFFAKVKTKRVPDATLLFMTLGLGTLVWGALTGNWFGYAPIGQLPFLSQFIVPRLYAFSVDQADAVIETLLIFCFSVGLGHLLLAHLLSFIKKIAERPYMHALADLGWIATMVGLYFFVLNLVVDAIKFPIPPITLPLIFGGLIAVLLFAGQEGDGFFRGLGRSLNIGNLIYTALTAISSFADVISYIRLFAVGLASLEIARSFNLMAEGVMASGTGGAIVAGVVVLMLGHSLNLVMGGLSVLVHGLRLKMLEFSGHLGNEWTGIAYKPFRNI